MKVPESIQEDTAGITECQELLFFTMLNEFAMRSIDLLRNPWIWLLSSFLNVVQILWFAFGPTCLLVLEVQQVQCSFGSMGSVGSGGSVGSVTMFFDHKH